MDVVVWLRSPGLEEYEVAFRDNKIDERVLPNLTQEDLKEIGGWLPLHALRAGWAPSLSHVTVQPKER
jgi:hypothetical protein